MADVIMFHHAQGLTPGVLAFADEIRAAGHRVTVPDLYDGATFDSLQAGIDHAEKLGFDAIIARGVAAASDMSPETVYVGCSLGVIVAREFGTTIPTAELFLYPGDRHLFADRSSADYDERATTLLTRRVLEFLEKLS